MARYFAEIDQDGTVLRVIVAEPSFVAERAGTWVETFMDGGSRKHYAGIGDKLDTVKDEFKPKIDPASWGYDKEKAKWKAPKPYPKDGNNYVWDESKSNWEFLSKKL
jgi:hypothetical protein